MRPLRHARVYLGLGFSYIGLILYLTLTSLPPRGPDFLFADKAEHLLAYGLLMAWFGQLYAGSAKARWAVVFVCMGALLEVLQGLGGVRQAEWLDGLANALGVLIGYGLSAGKAGECLERWERS